jgi:hypothetical protein
MSGFPASLNSFKASKKSNADANALTSAFATLLARAAYACLLPEYFEPSL